MSITASQLRANVYKILDNALATGVPIDINRKGKVLKIVPPKGGGKLKNLKKRDILNVDPEEIVHIDWSKEWKP